METKELKIQVPEGYEIDKENSTFEYIKFKLTKKDITYRGVCNVMFSNGTYFINDRGYVHKDALVGDEITPDKNIATNRKQLERLLALNQLLNIAEYYNSLSAFKGEIFQIAYSNYLGKYYVQSSSSICSYGFIPLFNNIKDAEAVIDNPNFREILDTIYKD